MNLETVLDVTHYNDNLFWFKTTKSDAWKEKNFQPGEFTMIGMGDDKLTRAYSIANSAEKTNNIFIEKNEKNNLTNI